MRALYFENVKEENCNGYTSTTSCFEMFILILDCYYGDTFTFVYQNCCLQFWNKTPNSYENLTLQGKSTKNEELRKWKGIGGNRASISFTYYESHHSVAFNSQFVFTVWKSFLIRRVSFPMNWRVWLTSDFGSVFVNDSRSSS